MRRANKKDVVDQVRSDEEDYDDDENGESADDDDDDHDDDDDDDDDHDDNDDEDGENNEEPSFLHQLKQNLKRFQRYHETSQRSWKENESSNNRSGGGTHEAEYGNHRQQQQPQHLVVVGSPAPPNWLDLTFCGCDMQLRDVQGLKQRLTQLLLDGDNNNINDYQNWMIRLSFPHCRLGCQDTLAALEDICTDVGIDALDLTRAEFHVNEMQRLIEACISPPRRKSKNLGSGSNGSDRTRHHYRPRRRGGHGLKRLELSLRYQQGTLAPLLEVCSNYRGATIHGDNPDDNEYYYQGLEHLKLGTRYPLEHRVRLVCVQELIVALLPFQNNTAAMVSPLPSLSLPTLSYRSSLKIFELTHCELDDEILAVLMGGLLALKDSLQMIHLHIEGRGGQRGGITWQSLPILGHLLTEFPYLVRLNLEIADCRQLLLHSHDVHNSITASPSSTKGSLGRRRMTNNNKNNIIANNNKNDAGDEAAATAIRTFAKALHQRRTATTPATPPESLSLHLDWSNVGWTKDVALQLLEAASHNDVASDITLLWSDLHFLCAPLSVEGHNNKSDDDVDEQFVYQLAAHLCDMKRVTKVALIDTSSDADNSTKNCSPPKSKRQEHYPQHSLPQDRSYWWNDDVNRGLLVEACGKSPSLQEFELRTGPHKLEVRAQKECDMSNSTTTRIDNTSAHVQRQQEQSHYQQPVVIAPKKRSENTDKAWFPF